MHVLAANLPGGDDLRYVLSRIQLQLGKESLETVTSPAFIAGQRRCNFAQTLCDLLLCEILFHFL